MKSAEPWTGTANSNCEAVFLLGICEGLAHGYATGQFGKNHLGDRNEFLPTVHGFDEFYGNLYHLNAEEESELPDYPSPTDFPNFTRVSGHAACCTPLRATWTIPPSTRASAAWASRRSRTPTP